MKARQTLTMTCTELQLLEQARAKRVQAFEERFLSRIKRQREVTSTILHKLNDKNFWRGQHNDYCWPEKYQWTTGVGYLRVLDVTDKAFLLEVTRKGGAKTTYWVRHEVLFMSDWDMAKQVRQDLKKGLQAKRLERLRELHQKTQEQEEQLAKLAEERTRDLAAWDELRKQVQAGHRELQA